MAKKAKTTTRRRARSSGKRRSYKRPGFFTSKTVEKAVRGGAVANALYQMAAPVALAVAPHIASGDVNGAMQAAGPAIREAVRARNLAEAFVPMIAAEAGIAVKRKMSRIARG